MPLILQASFLGLLIAFFSAWMFTRWVGSHALRLGLVDPTDDRKTHTGSVPRLGGIAIVASSALALGVLTLAFSVLRGYISLQLVAFIAGGIAIFGLGLFDDIHPIRPRTKLFVQLLITSAVAAYAFQFDGIVLTLAGTVVLPPAIAYLLTVTWLIGVMNAFNLIDGLDGLAGGVALIALTAMFGTSLLFQNFAVAVVAAILVGSVIGFLRYNFHPARIFLGDSGSLFLGFMLAGLGLLSAEETPGLVSIGIPILILGVPILDTGLTILRRFLRRQPIFAADRGHVHHRLLDHGHSPRNVALVLYVPAVFLGLAGFFLAYPADTVVYLVALLSTLFCIVLAALIHHLGFVEFQELGSLVSRGWNPRETIGRNVRFREASRRMAQLASVEDIFVSLRRVFADEKVPRAELRLQPWFLRHAPTALLTEVPEYDEIPVWEWCREGEADPLWWEIVLPLLAADGRRIGSLVLWEAGESATSLSHLHVISRHLRIELQHKLQLFGWDLTVAQELSGSTAPTDRRAPHLQRSRNPESSARALDDRYSHGRQRESGSTSVS